LKDRINRKKYNGQCGQEKQGQSLGGGGGLTQTLRRTERRARLANQSPKPPKRTSRIKGMGRRETIRAKSRDGPTNNGTLKPGAIAFLTKKRG